MTLEHTHYYIPEPDEDDSNRVGFRRKAAADLTPAEKVYIEEVEQSKTTYLSLPKERDAAWKAAYRKLAESRK